RTCSHPRSAPRASTRSASAPSGSRGRRGARGTSRGALGARVGLARAAGGSERAFDAMSGTGRWQARRSHVDCTAEPFSWRVRMPVHPTIRAQVSLRRVAVVLALAGSARSAAQQPDTLKWGSLPLTWEFGVGGYLPNISTTAALTGPLGNERSINLEHKLGL